MATLYPERLLVPFCNSGEKRKIPLQQAVTGNGYASLEKGFPPECKKQINDGGIPPDELDFNGILNALSQWAVWMGEGGLAKWDSSINYQIGAFVFFHSHVWLCLANNVNSQPSIANPNWSQFGDKTGEVIMMASEVAPSGYLLCDGRSVRKTDYPDLYAYIGGRWGERGDVFNIPDFRNRFPMGAATGVGQYVEAGLPNITGNFLTSNDINGQLTDGAFKQSGGQGWFAGDRDQGGTVINLDASRSSKIYGKSKTVQPPANKIGFFIRY